MKSVAKAILSFPMWVMGGYLKLLSHVWPTGATAFRDLIYREAQNSYQIVRYPSANPEFELGFHTPNSLCRYRVDTFTTKEPETLEWIETYGGGVFYDVGANVGLFAIFYAKLFDAPVYAFEPSVLNLALLARNVSRNGLTGAIRLVPMPLSDDFKMARFRLSMMDEGGSMSQFGAVGDDKLYAQSIEFSYRTLGVPLDALVEEPFNFHLPSLIKIDVDGLEDLLLTGAQGVLRNRSLRSVLIEVDETDFPLANRVAEILSDAGLTFVEKLRSSMFDDGPFAQTYNQIWERKTLAK